MALSGVRSSWLMRERNSLLARLAFSASSLERRNATVPVAYGGYPGVVCGPYGCWNSWGWGPTLVGYERIRFRAGTIVFDFVQQSTKHLVYRAVGEKRVHYNTFTLTQDDINGLVHHLLRDLRTR